MEIVKKPDIRVFASEAKTGEILKFPDVLRGWGITLDQTQGKPPLEWMNDAFNRIDLNNLYLLQQGIPEWDKAVRYPVNSIIKHADKLYLCIAENENNEPSANSDKWAPYVKNATLAQKGIVKLSSTLSDSETDAATPKVVNDVNKLAKNAQTAANLANDKVVTAQTKANQVPNPIKDQFLIGNTATGYKLITKDELRAMLAIPAATKVVNGTGSSTSDAISQKAFTDLSFGIGMKYEDVAHNRLPRTVYTNTNGFPIAVFIYALVGNTSTSGLRLKVDDVTVSSGYAGTSRFLYALIPPGSKYTLTLDSGSNSITVQEWVEYSK